MSDSSTTTERTCTTCGKKESELSTPLKQCAKCHTQAYCSRECQKDDWKNHKRACGNTPTSAPVASSEPSHDEMLGDAGNTIALLKVLSHDQNFRKDLRAIPQSASGLMYLSDFVSRTWREYWCPILPPQQFAELSAQLESFHGMEKEQHLRDMGEKFDEVKRRDENFDKDAWPRFNKEKYNDCLSRNFMAAKIVQTPSRQQMMGGSYNYSDEVKEVCNRITSV